MKKLLLRYKGKELVVELGAAPVRSNYQAQEASKEVKVFQDRYGMYRTVGLINGRVANFLVDTGASTIAMSTRKAKSLGIDFIKLSKGKRLPVGTANGTAYAYPVILDTVSVGGIEAKFIRASIIEGDATDEILFGNELFEPPKCCSATGYVDAAGQVIREVADLTHASIHKS